MVEDDTSLTDELLLFCGSDSISLEGLHEILQRYKMTSAYDSRHINDYFFFFCACHNEHVDEAIIQCLIEYFPDATSAKIDVKGNTPLHLALWNKNVTPSIIRLLVDAHPSSCQVADEDGDMPIHHLCKICDVNDSVAIEILKILLKDCSSSAKHASKEGRLPIHYASITKSPEFCGILIDAYPGSERMPGDEHGQLPFHFAIKANDIATVEYLYKLYPEAINCTETNEQQLFPIFMAFIRFQDKNRCVRGTVDVVKFLLKNDPNIKFQKFGRMKMNLLSFACRMGSNMIVFNDPNIDEFMKVVEAIYDAHPELINDDEWNFDAYHPRVRAFLIVAHVHASQAMNHRRMSTPNEKGRLPLHNALKNNVRLGSIKLVAEGNPSAVRQGDNNSAIPLHLACEHHDSSEVIEYLVGLDPSLLRYEDVAGNTAIHYACRGAKYATIALLLEPFDAVSVSKKNRHSKLPIDLLLESDAVEDRVSAEYVDTVFRLLRAYPGTLIDEAI